jgi:hypothetical protein
MWDWYLGQAGFGEQIQRYGEMFWPELVSTLFWAFLVIWAVLVVAAIVVVFFRQADVNEEMGAARGLDELLRKTHTGSLVRRTAPPRRPGPPPRHKAA